MLKRLLLKIVDYPPILDLVRRIIEANFREEREVIRQEFDSFSGSVLDVPCGTGIFAPLFTDAQYTGVDLGEKYILRARRRFPTKRFLVGDARDLPFPDASFDNILVIGFLHHLTDGEVDRALSEMQRVLKTGGTLLLIEDCPTRSRLNVPGCFLQSLDAGGRIRSTEYYEKVLRGKFVIEKSYPMRAGLWDYSVFVATIPSAV